MVPTVEAYVACICETNLARVTAESGLQLTEELPEHIASDDKLFVLLISLYLGSEVLH